MKIVTFNINGIQRRLSVLQQWIAAAQPNIICLQELKAEQSTFPAASLKDLGYDSVWQGQRAWNGVAICSRIGESIITRVRLPQDPADHQSRYIEAAVNGVIIACLYAPNGNPKPGPKFDYKLAWLKRLRTHARSLNRTGLPIVLAGDFNVAPTEPDIYSTKSWDDDALVDPEARSVVKSLVGRSWVDCLRSQHPGERIYTFWDYRRLRFERNAGLRIDHILMSRPLGSRLVQCGVDRCVRGLSGSSDHAPVCAVTSST